jgi:hypothetical protein
MDEIRRFIPIYNYFIIRYNLLIFMTKKYRTESTLCIIYISNRDFLKSAQFLLHVHGNLFC